MRIKKVVAALAVTGVVVLLLASPVLAGNGNNGKASGERPGWGYGDTNHDHIGPPGLVNDERPGWGYGDINHEHIGPPGKMNKGL